METAREDQGVERKPGILTRDSVQNFAAGEGAESKERYSRANAQRCKGPTFGRRRGEGLPSGLRSSVLNETTNIHR